MVMLYLHKQWSDKELFMIEMERCTYNRCNWIGARSELWLVDKGKYRCPECGCKTEQIIFSKSSSQPLEKRVAKLEKSVLDHNTRLMALAERDKLRGDPIPDNDAILEALELFKRSRSFKYWDTRKQCYVCRFCGNTWGNNGRVKHKSDCSYVELKLMIIERNQK